MRFMKVSLTVELSLDAMCLFLLSSVGKMM